MRICGIIVSESMSDDLYFCFESIVLDALGVFDVLGLLLAARARLGVAEQVEWLKWSGWTWCLFLRGQKFQQASCNDMDAVHCGPI